MRLCIKPKEIFNNAIHEKMLTSSLRRSFPTILNLWIHWCLINKIFENNQTFISFSHFLTLNTVMSVLLCLSSHFTFFLECPFLFSIYLHFTVACKTCQVLPGSVPGSLTHLGKPFWILYSEPKHYDLYYIYNYKRFQGLEFNCL